MSLLKRVVATTSVGALALIGLSPPATGEEPITAAAPGTGSITGQVVDADGGGIPGLCVQPVSFPGFHETRLGWDEPEKTAPDGTFTLAELPAEPIEVMVSDCESETPSYATTWFRNAPEAGYAAPAQAEADPIHVQPGQVSEPGTIVVAPSGSISGVVLNEATGEPVADACVSAHSPLETVAEYGGIVDADFAAYAQTASDGTYTISGLGAGDWAVKVEPCGSDIEPVWLHGKAGLRTADLFPVVAGQNTQVYGVGVEGKGAVVVEGGSISGTITEPDGSTPVEAACVHAIAEGTAERPWSDDVAWTDADGRYELRGLAEGRYTIKLDNCPRYVVGEVGRPNFLTVELADPVSITAAAESLTLDARFTTVGGVIEGTLVDEEGAPAAGLFVNAFADGIAWDSAVATTDSTGRFAVVGLPAGRYRLSWQPTASSYVLGDVEEAAERVVSDSAGELGKVDVGTIAVETGGRFAVRAVDSTKQPLLGLELVLLSEPGQAVSAHAGYLPRDYRGNYRPQTVPVGDYTLTFQQCNYIDYENPCVEIGSFDSPVQIQRAASVDLGTATLGVSPTRTQISTGTNPAQVGDSVRLEATVSGSAGTGVPSGSVTFWLDNEFDLLGSATLSGGKASISTQEIPAGVHEVIARYSGDAVFANSVGVVSQTVLGAVSKTSTRTSVTTSDLTVKQGDTITYDVAVQPTSGTGAPGGTVQLYVGDEAISDPVAVAGGSAQVVVEDLKPGVHHVSARYSGNESYASSAGWVLQQVSAGTATIDTTTAVSLSPSPSVKGETVTVTASIDGAGTGSPTGVVVFLDGGEPVATRAVNADGKAVWTTPTLALGSHEISAVYAGDATFLGSVSTALAHTVSNPTAPPGGGTGAPPVSTPSPTPEPEPEKPVVVDVEPGETASSSPKGVTKPTPETPVIASVTSPNGGKVAFSNVVKEPSPDSFAPVYAVAISAPPATVEKPLRLEFQIDSSNLPATVPPEQVTMFRNGKAIAPCTSTDGTATPDPCVAIQSFDGDDLTITVLSSHASEWVAALAPVIRVAGADRVATAVATSKSAFPTDHSAATAVLARDDSFADALVGGPLAVAKKAPLLLTGPAILDAATKEELRRVLDDDATVYLLGGVMALSSGIADELESEGYTVVRLAGGNRFETAVQVAKRGLGDPDVIMEATGLGFADALSAAAAAAKGDAAILLTQGDQQAPATREYLASRPGVTRYAVGGPASRADASAIRIAGADRYATAVAVAEQFFDAPTQLAFASGVDFPDALAGGAAAGLASMPLLLVPASGDLGSALNGYLTSVTPKVGTSLLYGGPNAVSHGVVDQLAEAIAK